jgi:hypothetical protein
MEFERTQNEGRVPNTAPSEIVPLGEAFRDEIYHLYKAYRFEADPRDYL